MKIRTLLALVGILAVAPLLNACSTMDGLGQDMQKGGQDLSTSAQKHQ